MKEATFISSYHFINEPNLLIATLLHCIWFSKCHVTLVSQTVCVLFIVKQLQISCYAIWFILFNIDIFSIYG